MSDDSNKDKEKDNKQAKVDRAGGQQGDRKERTTAEWVSLLVSVAIVLVLVGGLVYQVFARGNRPPSIEVKPLIQEVRQVGDSYYLPLDITNTGDRTAEDIEIMLSLDSGQGDPETMQFQVQFLDGGETENQTVVFQNNPAEGELTHTASFHVP